MSEEIEKKIKTLEEIRRDHKEVKYLSLYQATVRIEFLLALIDELTEALFKISAGILEATKHDPNVNPGGRQGTDPLPS